MLGLFFSPLIPADGCNAENVKPVRLQKHENRLLVAGARPACILVDDYHNFLCECRSRANGNSIAETSRTCV